MGGGVMEEKDMWPFVTNMHLYYLPLFR